MVELDIERERPDGQQEKGDVGVHQVSEDLFLEGHAERRNLLARSFERDVLAVEPPKTFAVDLAKEVIFTRGNIFDQMLRQRLLIGERLRLPDRALSDFDVA